MDFYPEQRGEKTYYLIDVLIKKTTIRRPVIVYVAELKPGHNVTREDLQLFIVNLPPTLQQKNSVFFNMNTADSISFMISSLRMI